MNRLALKGGKPVRRKSWPSWPVIDKNDFKLVEKVLHSGKWRYGGRVKEFEKRFAAYQNAKYGITAFNGTVALEMVLICSGIGAGDEVIVPSYTFVATASAVLKANAVPVFVDIDEDTFNIDPDKIEKAVTKKTKAIIPVHIAGLPCNMDKLFRIARKYNLKIIEDACHSWGSKWEKKGTGSLGNAGVFSFYMSKNITSGEGGIILTNDKNLAEQCRSYANCGRGKDKPWYEHYILGGNYRMTEIQAALLLSQMKKIEQQRKKRARNAQYLNKKFSRIFGIVTVKEDASVTQRAYHLYIFRYIKEAFNNVPQGRFIEALNAEGIPCSPGYSPLYKNPLFKRNGSGAKYCPLSCPYYGKKIDYNKVKLPVVEKLCKEAVWIKQSILLGSRQDMDDIVKAVLKIKKNV
jgi:dTDP-4-amino-4,6-dideoxygalactose transaminase